jgi:hypothetical protein
LWHGYRLPHKDNIVGFFSASEKRSVHMANKIAESCEMGDVLVLVGLGHYNIRDKLIKKGLLEGNIKGYYIPNDLMPTDTMRISLYEQELRSIEHDYAANSSASTHDNIFTIDLLKDANLNVTSIILKDYSDYLLGQPSHVEF